MRKAVDTLPAGDANHGAQFMLGNHPVLFS